MQTIAPHTPHTPPSHYLTQIQPIQQKILKKQSLFKKIITTFEGNLKKHTIHEYNITHQPQRKLGYPIQ